jgi:serine/threonine-protein kinase
VSRGALGTTTPSDDERGDGLEVVARLRTHLDRAPDDGPAQLRLAHALLRLGEVQSARLTVESLEERAGDALDGDRDLRRELNRFLAHLEERSGARAAAAMRWERLLGDDIDDPEAWSHLQRIRAHAPGPALAPAELPISTLASPEGLTTSRYRLVRELGRGATATVYLVRDERLDLPLALKVLHPHLAAATRAGARARFFAEARLAAGLRHPGVVAIYDIDEQSRSLAMEYVAGGTLRERLRRGHRPSSAEASALTRGLLETLAFVHAAGVVHGDLKPGNLLCRTHTDLVLADFGAAEIEWPRRPGSPPRAGQSGGPAGADPSAGAGTGADATPGGRGPDDEPAGTPLYLAPELFRGEAPGPRTDLFAAGLVVWELVTGRPARGPGQLLAGGATSPIAPLPLDDWTEDTRRGAALSTLVAALTAAKPEARPASGVEALALLAALGG